jgi:ParB/RepB/Spo0J family partition protein
MSTKTVRKLIKETTETVQDHSKGTEVITAEPDYKLIAWRDLQVSPTNPRRRVNEKTIQSMAESIRLQGILEPLIVRKSLGKYEIVCGERRYRAAQIAQLNELPCLIRKLSDEQVLDIQIHENLHREDVHPMDEAYSYQLLKEKLNCDVKELALRVGKAEWYVLNRLKLNQLIKEAQKDVDDGHLPLAYALEIAKYSPEIQEFIYTAVYKKEGRYQEEGGWMETVVKGETVSWKSFVEWINTNIHRLLSAAPFDPKATNLRSDGLPCVKCPERTGAVVGLFEPAQIGKKDACLNPACYLRKLESHIGVRRNELAAAAGIEALQVPLVRSWCYSNGKDYLGTESMVVISGAKRGGKTEDCDKAVSGIDIERDNYGQTVLVCLKTTGCKVHWPERAASSTDNSSEQTSVEEEQTKRLENHRARREEIWNAKVAEAVRVRVFKMAAEQFEKKFSISDVGTDFLPQLVARIWTMTACGDLNNLNNVIKRIIGEWEKERKTDEHGGSGIYTSVTGTAVEQFRKLELGLQFRILFLLVHGHKGTVHNGNNYRSQKQVRELAGEFEVNYALTDAEVRLELGPKKYDQVHKAYLDAVREQRKDAIVPRLFSEKWEAAD